MLAPIINPQPQFCDANGVPMAGGTIDTYIVGTDTRKDVWVDAQQTALQTNPIVLDAAGRCLMYGDGDYRLVLKDSSGNLIWDQPSTTIVSAAMAPVVSALTIADALDLLGVTDAIQTETDRAMAAEGALTTSGSTTDSNLAAEVARAEAAEAALNTQLSGNTIQVGFSSTNTYGYAGITFPTAYAGPPAVMLTPYAASALAVSMVAESTSTAFTAYASDATGTGVAIGFWWMSFGAV